MKTTINLPNALKAIPVALAIMLAFAGTAKAQNYLYGDLAFTETGTSSSFTNTSLTLDSLNAITYVQGDFVGLVPLASDLTASTSTISGLTSSPTLVDVTDFFTFASPGTYFGESGAGTSPTDRF